jgi:hypothetical protein
MRSIMRVTKDKALWLQETLLEFNGWQWGLVNFVHGEIASVPPGTEARWQFGIDIVYRTMTCDLIGVDVFMECHDRTSLLNAIRIVSPFKDSGGLLWNGTQISGTERLGELATAYFPSGGELNHTLNPAFIEALEAIFAENDVPWSEKPLLPIMPKAGARATEPR